MNRNRFLRFSLLTSTIILGLVSCVKRNPTPDKDAILHPYSLFFGMDDGSVINTNDGVNFRHFKGPGNLAVEAIATKQDYVLYASDLSVFRNKDGELTTNIVYDSREPLKGMFSNLLLSGVPNNLLHVPEENAVYMATSNESIAFYSKNNGASGSWQSFAYDTCFANSGNRTDSSHFLTNVPKCLIAWTNATSTSNPSLYFKKHRDAKWYKINVPPSIVNPMDNFYGISSMNGDLVFYPLLNIPNSVYHVCEVDTLNWAVNSKRKIPTQFNFNTINKIFVSYKDKWAFIGTNNGLYRMDQNNGSIIRTSSSMPENTIIYDVVLKSNIYQSENEDVFLYVATSKGLYKSEDFGENFTKVYDGVILSVD